MVLSEVVRLCHLLSSIVIDSIPSRYLTIPDQIDVTRLQQRKFRRSHPWEDAPPVRFPLPEDLW